MHFSFPVIYSCFQSLSLALIFLISHTLTLLTSAWLLSFSFVSGVSSSLSACCSCSPLSDSLSGSWTAYQCELWPLLAGAGWGARHWQQTGNLVSSTCFYQLCVLRQAWQGFFSPKYKVTIIHFISWGEDQALCEQNILELVNLSDRNR